MVKTLRGREWRFFEQKKVWAGTTHTWKQEPLNQIT